MTFERTEPRDSELWAKTYAAVTDARDAADAYIAQGKWIPRSKRIKVDAFDSGWPHFHSPLFPADDDPIDYSQIFGRQIANLTPLDYASAPALEAFLEYIESRKDLHPRLTVLPKDGGEARWLDIEAVSLPLSLLERSRDLGQESEAEILAMYLEREAAWLEPSLPVEYWVPLCLTGIELDDVFVIDEVARIETLTPQWQEARAPGDWTISAVPNVVAGAATHALVVGPYSLDNPGPFPRMISRKRDTLPLDTIDHYFDALRVADRVRTGYAQILQRPLGWADSWTRDLPTLSQVALLRRYPETMDNYGWLTRSRPISSETLGELPRISQALSDATARTKVAVHRLSLTDLRTREDDRTIDACIGIEALVGEGRDELTHKMALRAAAALSARDEDPLDAIVIFRLIKTVYAHRSKVVHGAPDSYKTAELEFQGTKLPTADWAEEILRQLVREFLLRPSPWTAEALDTHILSRLNHVSLEGPDDEPTADK